MAAPTMYYVDPAINANSGTGTIGDAFGDLQYALNTITRDATNGDQINIKAGADEILAASLTLATYGTPTADAPLILRGYTATANDGGKGEIDCNGATMLAATSYSLILIDLIIHNFGNNNGINTTAAVFFLVINCEIHKGASSPDTKFLLYNSTSSFTQRVIGCYLHDAGINGYGARTSIAVGNYVKNCPNGIDANLTIGNIANDCGVISIRWNDSYGTHIGNSIYSSVAATGIGLDLSSGATRRGGVGINNIIEGFSGAGGKGINGSGDIFLLGYNAFYNNATAESLGDVYIDLGNDATLAASPFTNPAGGDFSLLTSVVGAVDGAFPGTWYGPAATIDHADIGAVQNGAGTGGGMLQANKRGNKL